MTIQRRSAPPAPPKEEPKKEQALTVLDAPPPGLPAIPDEEMPEPHAGLRRFAFMTIIQANSERAGDRKEFSGQFWRSDTGDVIESPEMVVLHISRIRTKWPKGKEFSTDVKPECWSQNDVNAAPGAAFGQERNGQGRLCAGCALRSLDVTNAAREAGLCQPAYVAVLADLETEEIVFLRLTGTNAYEDRWTALVGPRKSPNLRRKVVRLGTALVKGRQGNWFVLTVEPQRWLIPEEAVAIDEVWSQLKVRLETVLTEAQEAEDKVAGARGVGDPLAGERPPDDNAPEEQEELPF